MRTSAMQIDERQAWAKLEARDRTANFFYGVATTGVFCRVECKSRLPLRANTRFFCSAEAARAAGFRACLRCKPESPSKPPAVAAMCAYLERHTERAVRLATLGKLTGMSPFTAQRLFKRTMGATPAEYQRALRADTLRARLRQGETSVTEAIYEAGYGSASRAYESQPLGMTPGRFLAGGRGETIRYAIAAHGRNAKLGQILIGATERGICWVSMGEDAALLEDGLRAEFPAARLVRDGELSATVTAVLGRMGGPSDDPILPLDLRGTAFQLRVWKALQQIPLGETRSYSQLAAEMGSPAATRAVARACATNRVAVLVPCHRVVGASGALTGYRWGIERKRELLTLEGARMGEEPKAATSTRNSRLRTGA